MTSKITLSLLRSRLTDEDSEATSILSLETLEWVLHMERTSGLRTFNSTMPLYPTDSVLTVQLSKGTEM